MPLPSLVCHAHLHVQFYKFRVRDPDLLPFPAFRESETPQSLSFLLASDRMFKEQLRSQASEMLTLVCATNLLHTVLEIPKHPLV